ncbi:MAG: histidine phosphatase family protein [Alphaproteobacteria bacterium]|nr:histidine phosphatase family protein [Alphaproteobacteria bacterium]
MSRTLLVMRHAKSSWDTGVSDHDRPLNARGQRDAPRMGEELLARGWLPDRVVVSDAERTLETVAWLEHAWGRELHAHRSSRLYLAGLGDLVAAIAATPPEVATLMLVGHNPGCEELVEHLSGVPVRMTTANVARMVADDRPWDVLAHRPCALALDTVLRPRELWGPEA